MDISVQEYVTLDEKSVFLILADGALANGNLFTYKGEVMYYSETYGAWAYLVITDRELTLEQVYSQVKISTQTTRTVSRASGDVDGNGYVNWNDVQLAYDLYNAKYDAFDAVNMLKFLSADVTGDGKLDVRDVAQIAWAIWKSEEERT